MSGSVTRGARPIRKIVIIGSLCAVGLTFFALAAFYVLGGAKAFEPQTLRGTVDFEASLHPVEATAELCADPSCVEGWRTDAGNYLRFASEGEAKYWETVLGDDGRRYENTVLDLRGYHLSFDQQRYAIDNLFSRHDWF